MHKFIFNFAKFFAMIFANVSHLKLYQQTLEGLINIKSRSKSYVVTNQVTRHYCPQKQAHRKKKLSPSVIYIQNGVSQPSVVYNAVGE